MVSDPAASAHDAYGRSLAVGDFGGDGRADLTVGSTGNDVRLHKGGFTKASGAASRYRLTTGLQSGSDDGARSLASGDINGDGTDDLVISGRYHPDRTTLFDGTLVYLGSSSGLTPQTVLRSDSRQTAAVGDITGDGYEDVVTSGFPDAHRDGDGGSISVCTGGSGGVSTTRRQTVDQDTPGVPGAAERDDNFGWAVSLDDVDGDGYADAAVSAFYESIGSATLTGRVTALRGSASGLTGTGAQSFSQATPGVPGTAEDNDRFGSAVRLADLDGDGHADLSVGADGENGGDGAAWSLRGSASGVRTAGAVSFGPSTVGVSTSGYPRLGTVMGQ
ncbi:FG-GAP-like repeat-containing protein [Streptomyces sp. NPDC007905]|uniref:FG-GAP-like repeat-containing protein n=1 Tax=Streptomyces sp. NPDC007905 TaxID=3364788 RepID=UPI0036E05D70